MGDKDIDKKKIYELLDKIYRILKWNLIQSARDEKMEEWLSSLRNEKILTLPKGYEKRKDKEVDELNKCLPYIGDIIHEKEEK